MVSSPDQNSESSEVFLWVLSKLLLVFSYGWINIYTHVFACLLVYIYAQKYIQKYTHTYFYIYLDSGYLTRSSFLLETSPL